MKEKRESSESSDSSSETLGREMSPLLITQPESETQYDQQNIQHETSCQKPSYYNQLPDFQNYNINKQAQVYEPPNNMFTPNNDYNYGLSFCNETNPYPVQYYPKGEGDVNNAYLYQNQYQYGNEMYNWYGHNMDSYNFYQS